MGSCLSALSAFSEAAELHWGKAALVHFVQCSFRTKRGAGRTTKVPSSSMTVNVIEKGKEATSKQKLLLG